MTGKLGRASPPTFQECFFLVKTDYYQYLDVIFTYISAFYFMLNERALQLCSTLLSVNLFQFSEVEKREDVSLSLCFKLTTFSPLQYSW